MCRPDGRHVLNNQGTDDYVLTFCPSDQRFANDFLQISPHGEHPCCSAIHFPLPGHVRDLSPIRARPWRAYIKNSLSAKAISNVIL